MKTLFMIRNGNMANALNKKSFKTDYYKNKLILFISIILFIFFIKIKILKKNKKKTKFIFKKMST